MKKDYIIPTIFFIKYEEESELLGNSIHDADCKSAAQDGPKNPMSGNTDLTISKDDATQDQIGAKAHGWLFDDNAFSDSW